MKISKRLSILLTACVLSMPLAAGASSGQNYDSGVDSVNGEMVDRLFGEGGALQGPGDDGKGDGGISDGKDGGGATTEGEGGA